LAVLTPNGKFQAIDVKKRSNKNKNVKKRKNVTKIKKPSVKVIKKRYLFLV